MGVFYSGELLTPCGLVGGCQTTESSLQLLISPLCLPVCLRVKARGQNDLSAQCGTELLLHPIDELRPLIGDKIFGDSMEVKDVCSQQLGGF